MLTLKETIDRYNLRTKQSLGQHFLLDMNLTRRIARAAGDLAGYTALEIGPGPGGLTRALLESDAKRIIAVELDKRCVEALQELEQTDQRLQIIEGDALQIDLPSLTPAPRAIIANLPYNVGTQLLINWLHQIDEFASLTLMFQKEVAERIAAAPRSKHYGRLSVLAQYCCHARILFDVPAGAFSPPPKVTSSIVQLIPRSMEERSAFPLRALENVTAAAFGQRRKMLRSSLKSLVPNPEDLLTRANIAPTARAEELSVNEFIKLTEYYLSS